MAKRYGSTAPIISPTLGISMLLKNHKIISADATYKLPCFKKSAQTFFTKSAQTFFLNLKVKRS
jgi:hypothetical protein